MPHGGTLTITAEPGVVDAQFASMDRDAGLGDYVVLGVADTGSGIPPEVVDRIFEPFSPPRPSAKAQVSACRRRSRSYVATAGSSA